MEQVSYGPPHVLYDSYSVPSTLYGIGILWSPLPYMEQVLYCPPDVKCLHVLSLMVPPYFICNRYHIVPLTLYEQVSYGPPTCEVSSCLI